MVLKLGMNGVALEIDYGKVGISSCCCTWLFFLPAGIAPVAGKILARLGDLVDWNSLSSLPGGSCCWQKLAAGVKKLGLLELNFALAICWPC